MLLHSFLNLWDRVFEKHNKNTQMIKKNINFGPSYCTKYTRNLIGIKLKYLR